MEYVIVGLLVVVIMLLIANLFKKNNHMDITDRISKLELSVVKEIGEFKVNFASDLRKDFDALDEKVERKLSEINNRVTERLDQNLEKTKKSTNEELENSISELDSNRLKKQEATKEFLDIDNKRNKIIKQNSFLFGTNPIIEKINVGFTNTIYKITTLKAFLFIFLLTLLPSFTTINLIIIKYC